MGKSNASTAPWPKNGPTPPATKVMKPAPPNTRPGYTTTISTDPTPEFEDNDLQTAFTTSVGTTTSELRNFAATHRSAAVLAAQSEDHAPVRDGLAWLVENLTEDLSIPALAVRASLPPWCGLGAELVVIRTPPAI